MFLVRTLTSQLLLLSSLVYPTLARHHIMDMCNWNDAGTFLFLMERFGLCGFTWLHLYTAFTALKLEVWDRCLSRIMREDRHLDQLVGGEWPIDRSMRFWAFFKEPFPWAFPALDGSKKGEGLWGYAWGPDGTRSLWQLVGSAIPIGW